jgi:lipopolysaccharide biosynthesis protein
MKKARVLAFYLPQYFPIPENDRWHGKGFTEWTNVAKAKPMFRGHYQPILPSELGFYDLRVPETREAQADLAREYGVEGFCYWHYWFGDGKRILERPFKEVLESGKPDFPFCLAWANASWTGIWYGMQSHELLEQKYLGEADDRRHFELVLEAFKDKRYTRVDNKPLFFIFDPADHPYLSDFMALWQHLAKEAGLEGVYFVGATYDDNDLPGFDATARLDPFEMPRQSRFTKLWALFKQRFLGHPRRVIPYEDVMNCLDKRELRPNELPVITPNWDNTARSGMRGSVLTGAHPDMFEKVIRSTLKKVEKRPAEERIIFVEAWNEWAEGNYLEPDRKFGRGFLEAIQRTILGGGNCD